MKNKFYIILVAVLLIPVFLLDLHPTERGKPIISQVESGTYVPGDIVVPENLKWLPVPSGTIDYAFFQSIGKVSNIVIGNFRIGEKVLILLQDKDADGKVDAAARWYFNLNRLDVEGRPDEFCSAENFKKLKELIVNGQNDNISLGGNNYSVSPKAGSISEIEKLIKTPSNVSKYQQGLRIKKVDVDQRGMEMSVYSYSINSTDNTANMAFEVKYYYLGRVRVSPIVNFGVYCYKSEDPFVSETVKKIQEISSKYFTR